MVGLCDLLLGLYILPGFSALHNIERDSWVWGQQASLRIRNVTVYVHVYVNVSVYVYLNVYVYVNVYVRIQVYYVFLRSCLLCFWARECSRSPVFQEIMSSRIRVG